MNARVVGAGLASDIRPLPVVTALVASFIVTGALTVLSSFGHGPGHVYGAPLPVGTSDLDLLAGEATPTTFSPVLFAIDVAITAALLLVIARPFATWGVLLATLAALSSLTVAVAMFAKQLDPVGIPIPASLGGHPLVPVSVIAWIDLLIWGFAAVRLVAWFRRSRAR
jgi:hypothetical protein